MTNSVIIRPCRRDEWPDFAECVYAMWRDIGASPEQIKAGWRDEILQFLAAAAQTNRFQGYVAVANGQIIGSAGGHLLTGLSPDIWKPAHRLRGYVWGVYVAPAVRGQGIAQGLTQAVVKYLQTLGCTQVHLHASPAGRPVYEKLEFAPSSEMTLMLPAVGKK